MISICQHLPTAICVIVIVYICVLPQLVGPWCIYIQIRASNTARILLLPSHLTTAKHFYYYTIFMQILYKYSFKKHQKYYPHYSRINPSKQHYPHTASTMLLPSHLSTPTHFYHHTNTNTNTNTKQILHKYSFKKHQNIYFLLPNPSKQHCPHTPSALQSGQCHTLLLYCTNILQMYCQNIFQSSSKYFVQYF